MFNSRRPANDEAWEAIVVDKSRGNPDGSNLYHYLDVQFAGGDTRKIRVDRKLWNLLSAGDEIVKPPGQDPIRK